MLWSGSADYSKALAGADTVGPFNTYDFSLGPMLLEGAAAPQVGAVYNGYYESYLTRHLSNGVGVAAPNLNTTGKGSGYELTALGNFQSQILSISPTGGVQFKTLPGGTFDMYVSAPNYDLANGTGFGDGSKILAGTVLGGGGSYFSLPGGGLGFGAGYLNIQITNEAPGVFIPPGIAGVDTIFTLQLLPSDIPLLSTISAVQGQPVTQRDLLVLADGNAGMSAVPVPPAALLLGSGVVGLLALGRRKRTGR